MMRGVPVDHSFRTERLIDWYYEEQTMELQKTLLLVSAMLKSDNIQERVNSYISSVFRSDKRNKEMVQSFAEQLKAEGERTYTVTAERMPGEDW